MKIQKYIFVVLGILIINVIESFDDVLGKEDSYRLSSLIIKNTNNIEKNGIKYINDTYI